MRICFDIDGTLCTTDYSSSPTDYSKAVPLEGAAQLLGYLKFCGHTIVLFTARGMGRSGDNVDEIPSEVKLLTFEQLEKWGFEYDELYFGKPSADLYIDDKAIGTVEYNLILQHIASKEAKQQTNPVDSYLNSANTKIDYLQSLLKTE